MLEMGGKFYVLRFGLKGLILLSQMAKIDVEKNFEYIIYCGLITDYPEITIQEIKKYIQELSTEELSSLKAQIHNLHLSINKNKVAELYSKAVGEMGIQPSDFYLMTIEEIDLAYEGYLTRKEIEANLVMTAINFAKSNSSDLIRLTEDRGYEIGSDEERKQTFLALGIEVKE